MPSMVPALRCWAMAGVAVLPGTRGPFYAGNGEAVQQLRLPTDSIGNGTVTLNNVVVGSSIQIETQAGAPVAYRVATGTTESFTVPVYSPGNPSNNLRIKVRKGSSAPKYQPFVTQVTAFVGAYSFSVAQVPDPFA